MSHQNIYHYINEYNNEIRASYNSPIDLINDNYFNNIIDINSQRNSIYYNTYHPLLNIIINNYRYAYNNRVAPENQVFSSNPVHIGKECSICLETVDSIETLAVTNCINGAHVFHKECINNWLIRSSTCPNCRAQL